MSRPRSFFTQKAFHARQHKKFGLLSLVLQFGMPSQSATIGQAGTMQWSPISKHESSGIVPEPIAGFFTGVWTLNVQEFTQFLFGLEVELITAAFRPTRRVPELIGAKGDVWHFRHSIIQLNLANFRAAFAARGATAAGSIALPR
jgi:hypothetical protein